jgi:hypothetical protein
LNLVSFELECKCNTSYKLERTQVTHFTELGNVLYLVSLRDNLRLYLA